MDMRIAEDFCTLPAVARPLRVGEFDDLFQDQTAAPHWIDRYRVEFTLAGRDDLYEQVSDLVARESACCSLFDFSITRPAREGGPRSVGCARVGVPASRHDVLEGLTNHAQWPRGLELSHER